MSNQIYSTFLTEPVGSGAFIALVKDAYTFDASHSDYDTDIKPHEVAKKDLSNFSVSVNGSVSLVDADDIYIPVGTVGDLLGGLVICYSDGTPILFRDDAEYFPFKTGGTRVNINWSNWTNRIVRVDEGPDPNDVTFGSILIRVSGDASKKQAPGNPVTRPDANTSSEKLSGDWFFRDLGMTFRAHPLTGQPATVKDFSSINQSIKNIVLTNKGERPFDYDFGSSVRNRLFELSTPTTKREIEEDIEQAILNYEPRVILLNTEVNEDGDNGVKVQIRYKVKTIDQEEEFNLFLERI